MSEAKIEIKIGEVSFSGEGNQEWLTKQLDKILGKAEELIKLAPSPKQNSSSGESAPHKAADFSKASDVAKQTLATFLKSKNAVTAQVDKFLATAIWVEAKENKSRLKTSDVSSALSNSNQTRLGNPSDALSKNIKKGYCEKDGREFFVTQEGKDYMNV